MIVIDATNSIAGRIGTFAAKKSLLGEEIAIINSEKSVITGSKQKILEDYLQSLRRGTPTKGPIYRRQADRLLRRIVRGMLPHKQPRGAEAFKRIMCYIGVPNEFKDKKAVIVPNSNVTKTASLKYLSLGELSKLL